MVLMQFLRLRRGVSEGVYTVDFEGETVLLSWPREQDLSGGDVGQPEPMLCVQSTSVAVPS